MSNRAGEQFLIDFFKAGGNNPYWENSFQHFKSAFVEPSGLDKLVADLRPVEGTLKVVIVDGHPRSGKTWIVLKVLETIVDELSLSPNECWTSGLDSLGVLPNDNDNLCAGAALINTQLQNHPEYKLVLLDDFLGTNELRPPGTSISDQSLKPFLSWDQEQNPWLRNMSRGAVLVLTGRSAHFMLLDILLGLNTRQEISGSNGLSVINPRRGLFRTVDKGEPFGAFDKKSLKEVCKKNRQYHPLRDEDPDWLVISTPLLAFDDCSAEAQTEDEPGHDSLTDEQKKLAASGLFGEDVDLIAEMILSIEKIVDDQTLTWRREVLRHLYKAYLVTIAPGLLFLDHTAYAQLGLDNEIKELVVRGLYLNETLDEFCSGRLPNEFYMIAINEHFTKYLNLAGRAFALIVNTTTNELKNAEDIPGLGIRGLLERGLHGRKSDSLKSLLSVAEFRAVVDAYLKHKNDCLLHLELGDSPSNNNCGVKMRPGMAAAIGWVLCNFYNPTEDRVRQTVTEWFPSRFRYMLAELSHDFNNWEDPNMPREVRDQHTLPGHIKTKWGIAAAYSAFLQWVIRMDEHPKKEGLLDKIIKLSDGLPAVLQKELQIIVDDELIWAFGEHNFSPGELFPVETFLKFLNESTPPDAPSTQTDNVEDMSLKVNRLFSLAWHNKWMENNSNAFETKASAWIQLNRGNVLELLNTRPELIDDNLQYHWFHIITQRAVWMRDWCFQDDPDNFERHYSQITEGSTQAHHNDLLGSLARVIIGNRSIKKERLRNILMLLGTRAARIPQLENITATIDELIDLNDELSQEIRESVLQAIFELSRQGYLDEPSQNVTEQFYDWCRRKAMAFRDDMERAWIPYWDGLNEMTHLDLLPRQTGGWEDVMPKSWRPL